MTSEHLGLYLGRSITVATCDLFYDQLAPRSLHHDTLLLWLASKRDLELLHDNLDALQLAFPLLVLAGGPYAADGFDLLLQCFRTAKPEDHVMTRTNNGDSLTGCVEELLQAAWPDQDRFSNWTGYRIVADAGNVDEAKRAVKSLTS